MHTTGEETWLPSHVSSGPAGGPGTPTTRQVKVIANPSSVTKSPEDRRLDVTDALSYMDAVRNTYQDKPEVYNRFLDTMRDFSPDVIDAPGVLQRVLRLFHRNPTLIEGFNTFLPVGYRIDVSAIDPNIITVTTPQTVTTQSVSNFGIASMHLPHDVPGFDPNLAHPLDTPLHPSPPPSFHSMTSQPYQFSYVTSQLNPTRHGSKRKRATLDRSPVKKQTKPADENQGDE
ncbi:paired amphipathic helix, partial [Armillaria borealis]